MAQKVAQPVFLSRRPWKKVHGPKFLGSVVPNLKRIAQRNRSPNRRKFAQSGHPGCNPLTRGQISFDTYVIKYILNGGIGVVSRVVYFNENEIFAKTGNVKAGSSCH
jgi:hypothetical protein